MSIGDWIVTFIVLAIPMVGIIMQIVWAFSETTQPNKKSFCQASLILAAFAILCGVLVLFVFGGLAYLTSLNHPSPPLPE